MSVHTQDRVDPSSDEPRRVPSPEAESDSRELIERADAFGLRGDFESAIRCYREAVALGLSQPSYCAALAGWAYCHAELRQYAEVVQVVNRYRASELPPAAETETQHELMLKSCDFFIAVLNDRSLFVPSVVPEAEYFRMMVEVTARRATVEKIYASALPLWARLKRVAGGKGKLTVKPYWLK